MKNPLTEIPLTRNPLMTKSKHVLYFDNHYTAPVMVRGEGPFLYDEEGKKYLETCGGSISNSLAYGREDMAEEATDLADITMTGTEESSSES